MIERYALYDIAQLSSRFNLPKGLPKGVRPSYNHRPAQEAPVIVAQESARSAQLMKWGLVAQGAKDTNSVFRYKTYNIPSEKIFSKHSWERLVRSSRCLVPANGFYGLADSSKEQAYYAKAKDDSLLGLAGVYSSWQDPEGNMHGTYSIITTEEPDNAPAFGWRMPVIIKPEDEARWLDGTVTDANSLYDMLRLYPSGLLSVYAVDSAVHLPKQNHARLIAPLNASA